MRIRKKLIVQFFVFAAVALLATGCVNYEKNERKDTYVLILDGFTSSYLNGTPALLEFATKNHANLTALSVVPSITPATHASMFTGVDTSVHGIVSYTPGQLKVPTIFSYLKQKGVKSCYIAGKAYLGVLMDEADFRFDSHILFNARNVSDYDTKTIEKAMSLKAESGCQVVVVYLSATDELGHMYGPAAKEMKANLASLNNLLNRFLQEHESENIIITADHGMCQGSKGGYHGTNESCSMVVPLIVRSPTAMNSSLSSIKDVYGLLVEVYG